MIPTRPLRRLRILIVGCGDVGMRIVQAHSKRAIVTIRALTSDPQRCVSIRHAGATPIVGNLDDRRSLFRLRALASRIIHLAPPAPYGCTDLRTRHLLTALTPLSKQSILTAPSLSRHLIYGSTSGVYGDCYGEWVNETRPIRPQTARAQRRVSAEHQLRQWGRGSQRVVGIVRIPGIYALNRLPLARLRLGTPALLPKDDVYTNHIHADDLARIMWLGLFRAKAQRVIHASDETVWKMGAYFDAVAQWAQLPTPERLSRAVLAEKVNPHLLSFMSESRRLETKRLHQEWKIRLMYPDVKSFLLKSTVL